MRSTPIINTLRLTLLAPCLLAAQPFSITNYQFISEQQITITQSYVTYKADLVNSGKPQAMVTATVTSLNTSSFTVVSGQDKLNFGPVPGPGQVTSSNTFTMRVNRAIPFSFANLQWTFQSSPLPPVANAGHSQTAKVGDTVTLNGSASNNPSGVGTLTYSWAFMSRPTGSTAQLNNPTAVMPTFILDVAGNYVVTLTVSNGVATSSDTVTVSTANSPPVANAGPNQTVGVGAKVFLDGSHSSDVDGDPLTYAWTLTGIPAGSTATLTGANTVAPTFIADKIGQYQVRLIVSDPTSSSLPATVVISTQNTPPVANAGPNQAVTVGTIVQLNGSGSTDVNGDPLTYHWSLASAPPNSTAVLSSLVAVNPTFTVDRPGTYVAQLIVNDGQVDSQPSTVTITTNAMLPPTANAGANQTVLHGRTVSLSGSGLDPQGLPLTYQWALTGKPPSSLASLSGANTKTPTFIADLPGPYTAQLVVNNGFLSSTPSTVTITTTNTLPVANAGANQNVAVGTTVQLSGSASTDADSDPLTYAWSISLKPGGSIAQLSSPSGVSPTFVPDLAGQYIIQLIVNDGIGNSAPVTVTITAFSNLTITTTSLANGAVGLAYLQNLAATGGTGPYTWQLTGGTLPTGLTLSPAGSLSGTPSATATATLLTFKASDSSSTPLTATTSLTLTILPKLTITTSALASGAVGVPYSQQLTATGGTGNFSWQMTGTLPAGLTFNSATGVISGTPTAAAAGVSLGFQVTDAGPPTQTASANFTLTIGSQLTISTAALPNGVVGTPYSLNLLAAGGTGTLTWSLTGAPLPAGLSLSSAGVISGTPTATATNSPVAIKVTDQGSPVQTATANLTITIAPKLTITTASLPNGAVNSAYSATLAAANGNGTLTWSLTGGTLPAGLSLSPAGVISGTPTVTVTATPLTFQVTDQSTPQQTATATLNLTIGTQLTITTGSLPNGVVGTPYSLNLLAAGGTGTLTWSLTGAPLPAGLSLSSAGVISGTPTATATNSPVAIKVTDQGSPVQTATANLTITIAPKLTITTASLPNGAVNSAYSATLAAANGNGTLTWSLTGGTLPAGLSLSPAGVISGTPTVTVTATPLTFQVTDQSTPQQTATATLNLTIGTQLTITTGSLPNGVVGTPYSLTLTAAGGTGTLTWSLTGGPLPAGLSLSTAGVISGTPSATATAAPIAIKVTDTGSPQQTATANFTITIAPKLAITTASLPNGAVNSPYSVTLAAANGNGTLTWSLTGGTLPAGLSLSPAGVLGGTPTVTATATPLTFQVTDQSTPQQTATATLNLTIGTQLTITTPSLPNGVVGTPYSLTLAAAGGTGTLTWSLTGGPLPAGLSLSTGGVISGTPSATATATPIAIKVTDTGSPQQTATANFTIAIAPKLTITTASLPNGAVNSPYSQTLAAANGNGTLTWSLTGGTLPAGLSLSPAGVLSGTPTVTATATPLTFQVTDQSTPQQTATATLNLTIGTQLTITTPSLPNGVVGTPYSLTLAAAGGSGTLTWSLTGGPLPAGLSLSTGGVISGTPSATATATPIAIKVTDTGSPQQTATANFTITIASNFRISTTSLPNGAVGSLYSQTLAAVNGIGALHWSLTGGTLPAGLSLNPSSGAITGTPTATATATPLTFQVTDSSTPAQTATANLTLTIIPQLTITTTSLPMALVGTPYLQTLTTSNGTGPFLWALTSGQLPAGLGFDVNTGIISGTPTAAATATPLAFKVTDTGNPVQTALANLTLAVAAQLTITTPTPLPSGAVGAPYTVTLATTGGTGTLTWALTSGPLPAGLSLNNQTGIISGTPGAVATAAPLTIQVTDAGTPNQVASKNFTLTILPAVTITTSSLPNGAVGIPYSASLAATGGSGTFTWLVTGGNLPAGLTMNASGVISGTPSAPAAAMSATYKVTDTVTAQTATVTLPFTIFDVLATPSGPLPNGVVGLPYSQTLTATGGSGANSWVLLTGTLPAGLTFNPATGTISGTPTAAATATALSFKVNDAGPPAQSATANVTITIQPPLTITTTTLPSGTQNLAYGPVTLTAINGIGALNWQITSANLPSGMNLNASTGVISGTPSGPASVSLAIKVTDAGSQVATTTLSLVINPNNQASFSVSSISVGQDLQGVVTISMLSPAGPSGQPVTISSTDSTKLLINTGTGPQGQLVTSIDAGQTAINIVVQARANSGAVTLTAAAPGIAGQGTITLTPSGFVLSASGNPGDTFNTTQGASTTLTVYAARLDSSNKFAEIQAVRSGLSVSVPISIGTPGVGSVSPFSVAIPAGLTSNTTTFTATATGSTSPASTTITAGVPATGNFVAPADNTNVVTAFVAPIGVTPCNTTVGKGLEAVCNILLNGNTASDLVITLSTANPNLQFSTTPSGAGQSSITVTVPHGHNISSNFYVYGLTDNGTAPYTVDAGAFGLVQGTVTFAKSGFIIGSPNIGENFSTRVGIDVAIDVYSVYLTATGDVAGVQNLAGPTPLSVGISNTPIAPAVNVGTLNPTSVGFIGGVGSGVAVFTGQNVGSTVLAVVQPAGFTTPNQNTSLTGTVTNPGINVNVPGNGVGYHLQLGLTATLGATAPAGQVFTITSNDPANLAVSASPTQIGQGQITITLTAPAQGLTFYLQGLGTSGFPTFTISSPGYRSFTGPVQLTGAAIMLSGANFTNNVFTTVGAAPTPLTLTTFQIDSFNNVAQQPAAPFPLAIPLSNSNGAVGSISPTTVNFHGDDNSVDTLFTPTAHGNTTVSIVSVPQNFVVFPGFGAVTVSVN